MEAGPRQAIRANTAATTRSQRLWWNAKRVAEASTRSSRSRRSASLARDSRVFTASSRMPRTSDVSAVESPCTSRSTNTSRAPSGSRSMAASRNPRSSPA